MFHVHITTLKTVAKNIARQSCTSGEDALHAVKVAHDVVASSDWQRVFSRGHEADFAAMVEMAADIVSQPEDS